MNIAAFPRMLLVLVAACMLQTARAQDYDSSLRTMATSLATTIERSRFRSVTVLDLTDLQGQSSELGRFLAQELADKLVSASGKYAVIDRANLQFLLKENKLSIDRLIDPETTRKLGKLIGIDALVVGTVTQIGDSFRTSARVIEVETAKVVGAQSASLPASRDLVQLANRGVAQAGGRAHAGETVGAANLQTRLRPGALGVKMRELITYWPSRGAEATVALDLENLTGGMISLIFPPDTFLIGGCRLTWPQVSGIPVSNLRTPADAQKDIGNLARTLHPGETITLAVSAGIGHPSCKSLEDAESAIVSFRLYVYDGKEGVTYSVRTESPIRKRRE